MHEIQNLTPIFSSLYILYAQWKGTNPSFLIQTPGKNVAAPFYQLENTIFKVSQRDIW